MPDIQLPAIRLYYEERGAGVPILCIHGTSSSAMVWEGSTPELERIGRVIVYDRRGCTRSERPEPYTTSVADHADDAAALLEALTASPAIVIGRSYGGEVAIDLALRYPEHVRALVLLEAPVVSLSPEVRKWSDELTDQVTSAAESGIDNVAPALLRSVLGDAAWEQFPEQAKRMFIANGPAILAEFQGGPLDVDEASLATIDRPVLLVASTDSPRAFRDATDDLAAALPHAGTVLVGGGHMINPSDPAVLEFIQGVIAGRESSAVKTDAVM